MAAASAERIVPASDLAALGNDPSPGVNQVVVAVVFATLLGGALILVSAPVVAEFRARRGFVGRGDRLVLHNRLTTTAFGVAFAAIALLDWLLVRG